MIYRGQKINASRRRMKFSITTTATMKKNTHHITCYYLLLWCFTAIIGSLIYLFADERAKCERVHVIFFFLCFFYAHYIWLIGLSFFSLFFKFQFVVVLISCKEYQICISCAISNSIIHSIWFDIIGIYCLIINESVWWLLVFVCRWFLFWFGLCLLSRASLMDCGGATLHKF